MFREGHPYAGDLDLFGPASLFELLNTTRTEIGELTLADWLRGPAPLAEVRARQAAIDELRPMLDFKEDVAVLASESPVGRTGPLSAWAGSPAVLISQPLVRPALAACALVTIGLIVLVYRDLAAPEWLFAWLFAETGFARSGVGRSIRCCGVDTPERDLGCSPACWRVSPSPTSPRLALHRATLDRRRAAVERIAQLRTLVSWLDSTQHDVRADRVHPAAAATRDRHRSMARGLRPGDRRVAARWARRRRWRRWLPSHTAA
jgi:hypothetical protein